MLETSVQIDKLEQLLGNCN